MPDGRHERANAERLPLRVVRADAGPLHGPAESDRPGRGSLTDDS